MVSDGGGDDHGDDNDGNDDKDAGLTVTTVVTTMTTMSRTRMAATTMLTRNDEPVPILHLERVLRVQLVGAGLVPLDVTLNDASREGAWVGRKEEKRRGSKEGRKERRKEGST